MKRFEVVAWLVSWCIALMFLDVLFIYLFIQNPRITLSSMSAAVAGTAAFLIGISFSLSGIGYYFNFLDRVIYIRKYLGIVGYLFALAYSILLLFVNPDRYWYGFSDNLFTADFILGLSAMAILTMMFVISNNRVMVAFGVRRWRKPLQLGYIAYALLVVRAAILEHEIWFIWLQAPSGLPPLRLVVSVFALAVLTLRLSLVLAKRMKR